ncbi:MAG TPA: murein biosynthesis integral membrane protein MurJ [Dehalococcoidia bacterium]|nr:murein biosynthesis integral membrane protein MurJ [Dehalococcoidia bacterium]
MADANPRSGPSPRTAAFALAALTVAFGFAGSRILGVFRTVAIADAFGSSPELSAYWVAFRIPDLIFQVIAGATVGSAFIPIFSRVHTREGSDRAWRLASNVLTVVALGTAVLCLIALIFAPLIVPLTAPGLGEETGQRDELVDKAVDLTRLMLLSPLLFSISGVVTGILNARQQFLLPALAPMVYNLSIIFGAIVLSGPWGTEGLAVGVVLGALLHLLIQLPGLAREAMRFRALVDLRDAATREIGRLMAPRVFGLGAAQMNFVITTFFASRVDDRAIANISYAWVIAQLPLALFGMALSTAMFPRLAEHVARDDRVSMARGVADTLRTIMFFTVPAVIGLAFLREPITVLLLQRGEFGPDDAALASAAVAFFCIGVVPQAGIEIHSRGFYALGDTRTPVILAIAAVVINAMISAALWDPFGIEGLAFAVSAASWAEWGLLYAIYQRRIDPDAFTALESLAPVALAAASMAIVLAALSTDMTADGAGDSFAWVLVGSLVGGLVFGSLSIGFRVPEAMSAVRRLRGLFGRVRDN